jgi:hypothetical protein
MCPRVGHSRSVLHFLRYAQKMEHIERMKYQSDHRWQNVDSVGHIV